MPLYEYHCSKCGKDFEVLQKFSDPPLTVHEDCGGTVEKLLSAPAFQFKGSGWYITDYAKKSDSHSKSEGSSHGSSETKGENKSEAKSGSESSSTNSGSKSESKSSSTPSSSKTSSSKTE